MLASWSLITDWAIILLTIIKSLKSSSRETSLLEYLSTLRAPMVKFPWLIGTHMKEMGPASLSVLLLLVRFKNLESFLIFGMTMGSPVATTLPVIPSPSL